MTQHRLSGGCHCGRVAFEVVIEDEITVHHCNCSICSMLGYVHLIVPAERFSLHRGQDSLHEYRFNTGAARHLFCTHCGVKSFYVPRSNPDGYSINMRCLSLPPTVKVIEQDFDGQNWEKHAGELLRFTQPPK